MPHRPVHRRPRPGLALGLCLVLAQAGVAAASIPARSSPDPASTRRLYSDLLRKREMLEREKQLKGLQLQLADKDEPYLLLDLQDRQIRVYVRATAVKVVGVATIELEGPRRWFRSPAQPPRDWANSLLDLLGKSGPRMEPEKIQPKDPAQAGAEEDPAALTPEKLGIAKDPDYPGRYTLIFRQGVAVSLGDSGTSSGKRKGWFGRAWDGVRSAVFGPELPETADLVPVKVWIHLGLEEKEAKSLYPTLYSGMRAMVRLPGDPEL